MSLHEQDHCESLDVGRDVARIFGLGGLISAEV